MPKGAGGAVNAIRGNNKGFYKYSAAITDKELFILMSVVIFILLIVFIAYIIQYKRNKIR